MPEILLTPTELRRAAEEIRTQASTVAQNVATTEDAIQVRVGPSKFSGARADNLRRQFTSQQEYMATFTEALTRFATFLDTVAERLPAEDNRG